MNLTVDGVGVDAGMIMVADLSYLDQFEDKDLPTRVFKVSNGLYRVLWRIRDTWNGEIEGTYRMKVTSGEVFVSDPCYLIGRQDHGVWMDWLDSCDCGREFDADNAFVIDEMGGDGCYKVELKFCEV